MRIPVTSLVSGEQGAENLGSRAGPPDVSRRSPDAGGSGLARELRVDFAPGLGELAASLAPARHAARRSHELEPAAHVVAGIGLEIGQHPAVVFPDELAIHVAIPISPAGTRIGPAPAIPQRVQA